jgi:hypothetical protein
MFVILVNVKLDGPPLLFMIFYPEYILYLWFFFWEERPMGKVDRSKSLKCEKGAPCEKAGNA